MIRCPWYWHNVVAVLALILADTSARGATSAALPQQNARVEILRSSEVPAANPELPAGFPFGTGVGDQSNLWMPAALSFIVRLLDDELIEDARDTGKRYWPRYPTALDYDLDAIAQLVDRVCKIDRRAAALVIVATNQCEQHRCDRRQID